MKKLLALFIAVTLLSSCTDNARVRLFGGTETVKLKPNQILLGVTWKEGNSLWISTQDTLTKEYHFYEKSNSGILEGEIIFK